MNIQEIFAVLWAVAIWHLLGTDYTNKGMSSIETSDSAPVLQCCTGPSPDLLAKMLGVNT